jgi:glycosyltransferase involved in cell wall biosynthesis
VLLVPGGSYTGSFRPYVALAQNLLPFDSREKRREGLTLKAARLLLLCWMQTRTFRSADGVIYMTEISRDQIERSMGACVRRSRVVYHGTQPRFFFSNRPTKANGEFTSKNPFRLLYVSILEPYKHQDVVVDSIGALLKKGAPVALDLVGPGSQQDQRDLRERIRRWDPSESAIKYHGSMPYDELEAVYGKADAFIFASSCETFGIILLEAMAAGLPVICSHRSAMPEVAGSAAVYFDPLNAGSLIVAIRSLLENEGLRHSLSFHAQQQALKYSWERCARDTFGFVREVHEDYRRSESGYT